MSDEIGTHPPHHTWIELNENALRHNLALFRKRVSTTTRLCFVVKANAYGHGVHEMVSLALRSGLIDGFAVHALHEAEEVFAVAPRSDVLILGYVPLGNLVRAVRPGLSLTVWNAETARALSAIALTRGVTVPLHLKIETGTNRHGVYPRDALAMADLIRSLPAVRLAGLSTHYANIEDTTNYSYAECQTRIFFDVRSALTDAGHRDLVVHAACSAAALLFPPTHLDMIRLGIAGYGLWPSRETLVSAGTLPNFTRLRPVLSWKARISQIRAVNAGQFVGYGCTFRTTRPSILGIIPVGYSEGYSRALSGISHVLVRGARAPVRGRICMNIFIVDLTDIPDVCLEEPVVLIGTDGNETVTAADLAGMSGTISYEIVARISPAIPRFVVSER
jgi:alanine racemase